MAINTDLLKPKVQLIQNSIKSLNLPQCRPKEPTYKLVALVQKIIYLAGCFFF